MRHVTTTVLTRIRPDRHTALEALLDEAARLRATLFSGVAGLHFARWAIIDLTAPEDSERDLRLVFGADAGLESEEDDPEALDRQLVRALVSWLSRLRARHDPAAALFDRIYQACEDYPAWGLAAPHAVEDYLLGARLDANARHVDFAYRVESPQGLRGAVDLLRQVDHHLDARAAMLARARWRGWRRQLGNLHRELKDQARPQEAGTAQRRASGRAAAASATLVYPFYRLLRSFPRVKRLQRGLREQGPWRPPEPRRPVEPERTKVIG
ncbi:MAG: hypothetical protein ICV87_14325, partial [Gemmatimonadetes bacterium]|nr:hypothetical protein [Gemmatimonadota bacterium]